MRPALVQSPDVRGFLALLAGTGAALVLVTGLWSARSTAHPAASAADEATDLPLCLDPPQRSAGGVDTDAARLLDLIQLAPEGPISLAEALHVLHVHGRKAPLHRSDISDTERLIRVITDEDLSRRFLGRATLVPTRHGVRFPTLDPTSADEADTRESHRDQCLAALAGLGIPLSYVLRVGGVERPLRDVLRDSLANFHLGQAEINWTATAYAHYLPPLRSWRNRYGESYTFDDLAREMIRRPLSEASCAGTHLLMALTTILNADGRHPILSPESRREVREYLDRCVRHAVATQQPDGSWRADWSNRLPGSPDIHIVITDDSESRLLATGHVAEWLLSSTETRLSTSISSNHAMVWLKDCTAILSPRKAREHFCPYSHAMKMIREISALQARNIRNKRPE